MSNQRYCILNDSVLGKIGYQMIMKASVFGKISFFGETTCLVPSLVVFIGVNLVHLRHCMTGHGHLSGWLKPRESME